MYYLNIVVFKIHENPLWIICAFWIIDFCIAVAPFEFLWTFAHCTQWTVHFKIITYKWKRHIHLISILDAGYTILLINDTINTGSLWPIICSIQLSSMKFFCWMSFLVRRHNVYINQLPLNRRSHFGKKLLANVKSPQCDQIESVKRNTAKHRIMSTTFKFNRIITKYNGVCCIENVK